MRSTIQVRHNIEVAHRLSQLPGRCQNIHGHSMWVSLELAGPIDDRGLLSGLDFAGVKREFRGHLDREFDHRLLLNQEDELASLDLPGARLCTGDPTTEHIAKWIAQWAAAQFPHEGLRVTVDETHTNAAAFEVLG